MPVDISNSLKARLERGKKNENKRIQFFTTYSTQIIFFCRFLTYVNKVLF